MKTLCYPSTKLSRRLLRRRRGFPAHFRRPPRRPATFEAVFQDYLAFLCRAQGLAPSTLPPHRLHVGAFLEHLWRCRCRRWRDITPLHIDRFTRDYAGHFARRYRATVLYTLRRFLGYLHFRGLIERPLDSLTLTVRLFQHERLPRFLKPDEVRRLLAAIDRSLDTGRRDYCAVTLLLATGLRAGEFVRLTLDDIDWRERLLHVRRSKTGPGRTVPIPAGSFEILVEYVRNHRSRAARSRHLFFSYPHSGKTSAPVLPPFTVGRIGQRMRLHLRKAGLKLGGSCHGLRHTFAQHLVEQGAGYPALQALLGHRSLTAVGIYARVNMSALREVADNDADTM